MRKVIFSALLLAGVAAIFAPIAFAQEEKPFTIHGEVRTRMEYTNNGNDFADSGTDLDGLPGPLGEADDQASYRPYRIRIAAEGHFAKNVSAWIELQNAGVFGGDFTGPVKNGNVFGFAADSGVSLYQGNLTLDKLWSDHFSLTLGRSELVKGNELHLGDLDFYAGIVHDGAIANWDFKKVDITGWVTRPIEGSVFHPDNSIPPAAVAVTGTPATQYFWGAYVTWDIAKEQGLDLYFMENRNRAFVADSPTTLDMVGVRWFHDNVTKNGAVWNGEVAQQFGQISDLSTPGTFEAGADLSGMVIEAMFGWNFKVGNVIHRPYGKYEMASGNKTDTDATPGDKEDEGFRPFFTDFHNRLGHGDWFALTGGNPSFAGAGLAGTGGGGIQAFSVGYTGWTGRHSWGAEFWDYSLDQDTDLGPVDGTTGDLGKAIDLFYGFNYSKNVTFEASWSQLSPDDALTGAAGPDDSAMRLYGQARLRF
ncbi:MAG TPA: hypothetical protein VFQ07_02790 [Candidatus Polarisedimenticolia bacterium]|nr:hypothetical protein [Candidatus Polarisedimenticolia bacterium]